MISLIICLNLLFSVAISIFVVKPESTPVLVNKLLTLKCSTNSSYILYFAYNTPPGYTVNSQSKTEGLPGGGTVISTTFLVTKELNATNVTCWAAGTNYHTDPATITAYAVPNGVSNIKVCQLDHFVFVSWDQIFAPKGIKITYSISDNRGLQTVTNNSSYSFFFNETSEIDYDVNITVTVTAMAANQTGISSITTLPHKLNGTVPLYLSYDKDNSSRVGVDSIEWVLLFKVELHHLHASQCIIDNDTLKSASVMNCRGSNSSCIKSTNVHYDEHNNEINSTNYLPPRETYKSRLCFNYLEKNIISQPVQTSTHDIQDIENISPNDTSLCLRFHLIHHAQSQEFHLHLRRDNINKRYNVTLPSLQNKTRFEWCASTIPAASSNNNGTWSIFAYDGPGYTNPAVTLENIVLNITETINTATTYNIIASTTHTTHTTTTSLSHSSYSTSIVSSSRPSPSSAVTTALPSIVNLIVTVTVSVVSAVFIALVITV